MNGRKKPTGTDAANAAPAMEPIKAGNIIVKVSGISGFIFLK